MKYNTLFATLGLVMTVAIAGMNVNSVSAVSKYWTNGGYGTSNYNWNTTQNWSTSLPATGDKLVFNGSASSEEFNPSINNLTVAPKLYGITFTGTGANGYSILGNTIHLDREIRDQSSGTNANGISNNIYTYGDVNYLSLNNAILINQGNTYLGSGNLYLKAYHSSVNMLAGSVNGSSKYKVYVVGDKYGTVAFSDTTKVTRPTIIKDKGYLALSGRTSNIYVTSTGLVAPIGCSYTKTFLMKGYMYPYIEGAPSCSNQSKVIVSGKVDVRGGTLVTKYLLSSDTGYVPTYGKGYVIVSNDGTEKVTGTFKGLPEGARFYVDGYKFKISYKGGTGNDIVITMVG